MRQAWQKTIDYTLGNCLTYDPQLFFIIFSTRVQNTITIPKQINMSVNKLWYTIGFGINPIIVKLWINCSFLIVVLIYVQVNSVTMEPMRLRVCLKMASSIFKGSLKLASLQTGKGLDTLIEGMDRKRVSFALDRKGGTRLYFWISKWIGQQCWLTTKGLYNSS